MFNIIPLEASSQSVKPFRSLPERTFLPAAYRLSEEAAKGPISPIRPQAVFIEIRNHQSPQIIKYLKGRNVEVIINSNGTLLTPTW